jgi:hypothetical protein
MVLGVVENATMYGAPLFIRRKVFGAQGDGQNTPHVVLIVPRPARRKGQRLSVDGTPQVRGVSTIPIHVNRSELDVLQHSGQNKYTLQKVGHAPVRAFFGQNETTSSLTSVSKMEERILEENEKTSGSKAQRQESRRSPRTESVIEVRSQDLSFLLTKKHRQVRPQDLTREQVQR